MSIELAARGAAFLDEKDPGWRDRINRETLNLREPCHCVVGQSNMARYDAAWRRREAGFDTVELADPYAFGLGYLGVESYDDHEAWENETRFGFVASVMFDRDAAGTSWLELQQAWDEILAPVAS